LAVAAARGALQIAEGVERGADQSNTDTAFATTVACRQRHLVLPGGDTDLLRVDGDIAAAAIDCGTGNDNAAAGTDRYIALTGTYTFTAFLAAVDI